MNPSSQPTGAYRAFIALSLPPAVRDYLARVQDCLISQGLRARWVRPASMHLTLKFIGRLEPEKVAAMTAVLDDVSVRHSPMTLSVQGLGGFPSARRARVLWMGIGGECDRLGRLQQDIDAGLAGLGYPPDKRDYRGHLTLARAKGQGPFDAAVARILDPCEPQTAEVFAADRMTLYHSHLRPDGAVYDPLHQILLAASGGGLKPAEATAVPPAAGATPQDLP